MPPEITQEELDALKASQVERDNLKKEKEAREAKDKDKNKDKETDDEDDSDDEDDLNTKVAKNKKAKEAKDADRKQIESALKFNLSVESFVKDHADLLPDNVAEILKEAEGENYDTAVEKSRAVKSALIKEFFSIQDNVDSLTPTQKKALEDFNKLTKNGREEKADSIYENIFEPALITMKKVKKAEEIGKAKSGLKTSSKWEDKYKANLIASSEQTYLGKKKE